MGYAMRKKLEELIDEVKALLALATTMYDGEKDVSDKDTPEALAESQAVTIGILIQAKEGNTGWVKVGNATSQNHQLNPLDVVVLPFDNLATVHIDVEVNGEGVTYLAG